MKQKTREIQTKMLETNVNKLIGTSPNKEKEDESSMSSHDSFKSSEDELPPSKLSTPGDVKSMQHHENVFSFADNNDSVMFSISNQQRNSDIDMNSSPKIFVGTLRRQRS